MHGRSDGRSPSPLKKKFYVGAENRTKKLQSLSLAAELRKVGQRSKDANVSSPMPSSDNVIDLDPPDSRSPHRIEQRLSSSAVINLVPSHQQQQSSLAGSVSSTTVEQRDSSRTSNCSTPTLPFVSTASTTAPVASTTAPVASTTALITTTAVAAVHSTLPALPLPNVDPDSDSDMDLDKSPTSTRLVHFKLSMTGITMGFRSRLRCVIIIMKTHL